MIEKILFAPRMPVTLPYLTLLDLSARSTRREEKHGRGQGREEGHRTHQHYDDEDDDEDGVLLRFCCIVSHNGKKIEIKLVAFVIIIIILHILLKVGS